MRWGFPERAYFIYFISRFAHTSFAWTTAGLFFLGIILHRLFCVRTTIDKLIFPNAK
jgi:hypothetical protein